MKNTFRQIAAQVSYLAGTSRAFVLAVIIILAWLFTGPMFNFSDTWQLVINTGTTIITFLMVFLIQNTQNRDSKAMHIKLDELLKGVKGARTSMVGLEEFSDEELESFQEEFKKLHERYATALEKRKMRAASKGMPMETIKYAQQQVKKEAEAQIAKEENALSTSVASVDVPKEGNKSGI